MSNPSVKSSSAQPERVKIFDTTLRDGEQAPGFSMSVAQKLEMAHRLDRLGVDVIEAGFAAASPGDFEAIRMVAEEMQNASVCSLARATPKDIEAAARALDKAKTSRCHILLATSPIHREAKLKMTCAEVLQRIEEMVSFAREAFDEIEFSAEDALRTEHDFLIEAIWASQSFE